MNTIILYIVSFSWLWPWHHNPQPVKKIEVGGIQMSNGLIIMCEKNSEGIFFLFGDDGTVGVSSKSCQGAIDDWHNTSIRKGPSPDHTI